MLHLAQNHLPLRLFIAMTTRKVDVIIFAILSTTFCMIDMLSLEPMLRFKSPLLWFLSILGLLPYFVGKMSTRWVDKPLLDALPAWRVRENDEMRKGGRERGRETLMFICVDVTVFDPSQVLSPTKRGAKVLYFASFVYVEARWLVFWNLRSLALLLRFLGPLVFLAFFNPISSTLAIQLDAGALMWEELLSTLILV